MGNPRDEFFMARALELAKRGWGDTSPNPMVGAVLVKDGEIVGEGWHKKDGAPHAEIECLRSAKVSPEGATIYVSLEPCSTHGRTGACCDALTDAKIGCVKIGALDPNPLHAGRALQIFAARNIPCESGILESECRKLNFIFNYSIVEKRALLALKLAVSRDGKIAKMRGEPTCITGAEARADTMKWRRLFPSIGVGRGTLEADNPSLSSRGFGGSEHCAQRLIFDAKLNIANLPDIEKFKVFSDAYSNKTRIVCDVSAPKENENTLKNRGIAVMRIESPISSPEIFWDELKRRLYEERIVALYMEGGANLAKSACDARAVDFAFEYRSSNDIGESGLSAYENGARPFDIDGEKIALGNDTLEFGKTLWKPTK